MMKYQLEAVGVDFVGLATKVFVVEEVVDLPVETVWQAFSDSANWKHWFPDVNDSGYKTADGEVDTTPGPGTTRWSHVGKHHYRQTMLEWQKPSRWSYRIDECTASVAYAHLEVTEFEAVTGGTLVRWTLACNPRWLIRLASPFVEKTLSKKLQQALKDLKIYSAQHAT